MNIQVTQKVVDDAVYVSLVGPLMDKYARVPYAQNSIEARWIINQGKLKSLWCSTYTEEQVREMIAKYGGEIITLYADEMDFDMYELEMLRKSLRGKDQVTAEL